MNSDAGAPPAARWRFAYAGPGVTEWLLGGLCTAMIADCMANLSQMDVPQTAPFYYSQTPGVIGMQLTSIGLNVLVLVLLIAWIITQKNESPLKGFVMGLSAMGSGLIWTELMIARGTQPNATYVLSGLPYHPVSSWGLLGAQAYITYLIFQLPDGRLNWWMGALLKAAFAACAWLVQISVWDVLWRSITR